HHSYDYDPIYDELNTPEIAPSGGPGGIYFYQALMLTRYEEAGYAFGKLLILHPQFIRKLNALIYTRPDGGITDSLMIKFAAQIAPTVEGQPFANWYANQQIFNPHPPAGCTISQRQTGTFDFKCRSATSGAEVPQAGRPVTVDYYDYAGNLL